MNWAAAERRALVETLRTADPYSPTACEGWDVRRLLAHLVQREQSPVAMVLDAVSRPAPGHEPQLNRLVETTSTPAGYQALVQRFADGPPAWSPMSWAGEQVNLVEFVVHHEDIRRSGSTPAEPRTLPAAELESIWAQLGMFARLGLRQAPVGVALTNPAGSVLVGRKAPTGIILTGDAVELALAISGRRSMARVELTGPPEAIVKFSDWAGAI